MIYFETLRWKNFLSTGDTWTEIEFNKTPTTLIVGHNGSGKSTLLDALSFGLFGKAHRNVNKNQLINSVNGKGTLVEVEFSTQGSDYKIIRGIKPNKFEIYKNKALINQDAHAKEYQKLLELNILKLNHKTFHQVVVLGSSSFVPFMQLTAQARREVIEDLLDINVFSKMNALMKERNSTLKGDLQYAEMNKESAERAVTMQNQLVEKLSQMNQDAIDALNEQADEIRTEITDLALDNSFEDKQALENTLEDIGKDNTVAENEITELRRYKSEFGVKLDALQKEVAFYDEQTACPTCHQSISIETKADKTSEAFKKIQKYTDAVQKAEARIASLADQIQARSQTLSDTRDKLYGIQQAEFKKDSLEANLNQKLSEIKRLESNTGDLDAAISERDNLNEQLNTAKGQSNDLKVSAKYHMAVTELLKDTGIKTKIIKQYVPVINQLTNGYLQTLDFFVSFHLDDTFSETIRSRHRDDFSYDSFSEGEKQRIDLALLFTWRQIAKLKNSVATNLLLLDETFDSSLDADGVQNLLTILDTLDNKTHVFVISHKGELLEQNFDRQLQFVKEKNFSKIAA